MSSYRQLFYHLVFGTKLREPSIPDKYCLELYKYIWGIVKAKKCQLYQINGIENHIHLLVDINPQISLVDFIKDLKVSSSTWMRKHPKFPNWNGWSVGYGAFTLSVKEKDRIINYIKKQKEHHESTTFVDEYKKLLNEHGIPFEEKYLFE